MSGPFRLASNGFSLSCLDLAQAPDVAVRDKARRASVHRCDVGNLVLLCAPQCVVECTMERRVNGRIDCSQTTQPQPSLQDHLRPKIFEAYLKAEPGSEVAELLELLIQAQQTAITPLSSYLRRQDVIIQDLQLDEKLMAHAMGRHDVRSRLRFIHDGLERAVSWYRMQLVDRQMTSDPDLEQMLFELGENDAAKLWRAETVMNQLRVSVKPKEKDWEDKRPAEPRQQEKWKPRLVEDVGRPSWSGDVSQYRSGASRPNRQDNAD